MSLLSPNISVYSGRRCRCVNNTFFMLLSMMIRKKCYLSSKQTFAKQQQKQKHNQMCMKLAIYSIQLNWIEITVNVNWKWKKLFKTKIPCKFPVKLRISSLFFFFFFLFNTMFSFRYFEDYLMLPDHDWCVITLKWMPLSAKIVVLIDLKWINFGFFFEYELRDNDIHRKCINVLLKSKQRFLVYDFYQCDANLSNTVRAHCPIIPSNVQVTTTKRTAKKGTSAKERTSERE